MSEAEKKKKEQEEPELIPVGPAVDADEPELHKVAADKEDEPEAPEEEEEAEDERLGADDDEERPRRKETAKERRARDKQKRHRDRLELNFYRQRNEALEKERAQHYQQIEGRINQLSTAAVDQRMAKIEEQLALADNVSFEALKNGTREDYRQAQDIRDKLNAELARLQGDKRQQKAAPQQQQQQQQRQVDPRIVRHGTEWAQSHPWFEAEGNEEATKIVHALDDVMSGEGYDPTTGEYWEELSRRVKKRLPEKFKTNGRHRAAEDEDMDEEEEEERPVRQAGPKFSSGGRERPLRKGEVYISAERKQAMKDAGVWDDLPARQRLLKRYAQMDAELSASRQH